MAEPRELCEVFFSSGSPAALHTGCHTCLAGVLYYKAYDTCVLKVVLGVTTGVLCWLLTDGFVVNVFTEP